MKTTSKPIPLVPRAVREARLKSNAPTPGVHRLLLPDAAVLAGRATWNTASGYAIEFTRTGNLELRDRFGTLLWESRTDAKSGHTLIMQTDGNLVMYDASRHALWATGTEGNPGAFFGLLEACDLAIFSADHACLWRTNTLPDPTL